MIFTRSVNPLVCYLVERSGGTNNVLVQVADVQGVDGLVRWMAQNGAPQNQTLALYSNAGGTTFIDAVSTRAGQVLELDMAGLGAVSFRLINYHPSLDNLVQFFSALERNRSKGDCTMFDVSTNPVEGLGEIVQPSSETIFNKDAIASRDGVARLQFDHATATDVTIRFYDGADATGTELTNGGVNPQPGTPFIASFNDLGALSLKVTNNSSTKDCSVTPFEISKRVTR